MKRIFEKDIFGLISIVLIGFIIAAVSYPSLPQQIPMHWGITGEADSTDGKWAIFFYPLLMLGLLIFLRILPKIDPKKENYRKFGRQYNILQLVLCLFMLMMEIYVILWCRGVKFDMGTAVMLIAGCLFVVLGNLMPKFRVNWFCGIRTPWTLANEEVWYCTHRFGGKAFFCAGFLMILSAFLPAFWKIAAFVGEGILLISPVVYSYFCYRKQNPKP